MGLPGNVLRLPKGAVCDDHPDSPAVVNIQGEIDSFGHEEILMCQSCYRAYRRNCELAESSTDTSTCEWCHGEFLIREIKPFRDPEEGTQGPVYHVCTDCRSSKINAFTADRAL